MARMSRRPASCGSLLRTGSPAALDRAVRRRWVTALLALAASTTVASLASAQQAPAGTAFDAHSRWRDSLDLRAALSLARERSPAIAAAAAAVREAEGGSAVARSGRGPRFAADAWYLRFEDPPAVGLAPLGFFAPVREDNYLLQLEVTQPVYTFGRVSSAVRAANFLTRAAESSAAQAEVEVTAAVAQAFDDVLLARALREVGLESAAVLEAARRVAAEHYEAGTVARLDVLRAETRLSSARAAVRAAESALETGRERLAALLGLDPAAAPPVAGALEYAEQPVDLVALERRARAGRPDVRALNATARAQRARASGARAARLPALSLYAATLGTRPELVTGEGRWAWDVLGGVYLSWPFFDSGAAAGESRAAEAAADRAEAQARQATQAAVAAVRAQARELERAAADVEAGRENVWRAERALEIAQERYAAGVGIQLEVFESEGDLTHVRADLLRAIHAYRSAAIGLRRATGLPADAPLPSAVPGGEP